MWYSTFIHLSFLVILRILIFSRSSTKMLFFTKKWIRKDHENSSRSNSTFNKLIESCYFCSSLTWFGRLGQCCQSYCLVFVTLFLFLICCPSSLSLTFIVPLSVHLYVTTDFEYVDLQCIRRLIWKHLFCISFYVPFINFFPQKVPVLPCVEFVVDLLTYPVIASSCMKQKHLLNSSRKLR